MIGLLLAFRTNSSYDRWWEARTLWGAIVNDSRSWVRQLLAFSKPADDRNATGQSLRRMALRQAAWCYALSSDMRGQDPLAGLEGLIDPTEIDGFYGSHNVPNDILQRQAMELRKPHRRSSTGALSIRRTRENANSSDGCNGRLREAQEHSFPGVVWPTGSRDHLWLCDVFAVRTCGHTRAGTRVYICIAELRVSWFAESFP